MTHSKNIISLDSKDIIDSIKSGKVNVCVIGIGRIGLPTALSFANLGIPTIGLDINSDLVNMINSGIYPLKDEPYFDKIFDNVIKKSILRATTNDAEAISISDIVILSLPTPMDSNNVPDYSALISVGKRLKELLRPESLVIVESTIEPGFIENVLIPIIEGDKNRLRAGKNFWIAVCPETANPGEIHRDFSKVPRLVGAIDIRTTELVSTLYHYVFGAEIIKMPDCKTANAAKLTANVFRDVNIAFVNELALLFEDLGIDIIRVLEACDKKYNFQTHYPGAGVGGPCLPVNSYQMLNSARGTNTGILRIIKAARETNEYMPYHVVDLLIDALNEVGKSIKNSTIALLGLTYKPNIRDIQLSPAQEIIKRLVKLDAKLKIYDPYFKSTEVFEHKTEGDLISAVANADATVIITAHEEFLKIEPSFFSSKMNVPVVIDCRGMIDIFSAKKAGLIFRGIGRGGI